MQTLFQILEIGATSIENIIILSFVTTAAGAKRKGKLHYVLILAFSFCASVLVSGMNLLSLFSFLTPLISMCFVIFISSKITSEGSLTIRAISCVLIFLLIQTLDYTLAVFLGFCFGVTDQVFAVFSSIGIPRAVYLAVNKSIDIGLYFLFRPYIGKLRSLSIRLQRILLILSLASYAIMQYLFQAIISPNIFAMQTAVVASWFFIICFVSAILVLFSVLTNAEQSRHTQAMLQAENSIMTKNYQSLHADRLENAKRQHDFNHHLKVIRGLLQKENYDELTKYIESLVSLPVREAELCHSGNDIIDAIINCKAVEAEQSGIEFSFQADFHMESSMDPTDICGILSNQIDNAIEACRLIPSSAPKKVIVEIKQHENFAFFTVKNTVTENPFLRNPNFMTTKADSSVPHGLGIKNIRDISNKYNGSLLNEYDGEMFVSTASVCLSLLNT